MSRRTKERGVVLVLVLWVALGLVSLALLFGDSMLLEYRAADNAVAERQASEASAGAARYVRFVLANTALPGEMPDPTQYAGEDVPVGEARFWLIGRDPNETRDTTPHYGLVDEAGKLNLNTASVDMLEGLSRMTPELAAAIIDWRDEDSDASTNGAESDIYARRIPPYNCKNAPFESVEELRLVSGADLEILYGEDTNRNGVLDPNEDDGNASPPNDNSDGRLDPGILEYVTVYSREPNRSSDGTARVNINQNRAQLEQVLTEVLGQPRAQAIMQTIGPRANFSSLLDFYARAGVTVDEGLQLDDRLTTSGDEYARGLVNINTAPPEVLSCLPGIGQEGAQAIVGYRQNKTVDDLATVAWLLSALDPEKAVQAGPFVTVRSYQWTADVAAVGRYGRGLSRVVWVIDAAGESPLVVYRRELSHLGWPLGQELRQALASASSEAP